MLAVGSVIKDLWRVEEIKRGGMGYIYVCRMIPGGGAKWRADEENEATPTAEQRRAVYKTVTGDFYLTGDNQAQFDREALIWTTLPPHPYVVTCESVDRIETAPLILLEYVSGGSLRDRLDGGLLDLADALRIFRQVCTAMEFIAAAGGIHHRDLKPENILLTEEGDAKITDFGLASLQRYGRQSGDRFWGGTLPYMSPEAFGLAGFGAPADVYSFGAVMYEVLTGRQMVTGATVAEFRDRHLRQPMPDPGPGVPAALAAIVARCVEKRPDRRYQNFADLDAALAAYIEGDGLAVTAPAAPTVAELEERLDERQWGNRGYAYAQLQMYEESMTCYERALAIAPEGLGALLNYATGLTRLGRLEEALEFRRRAVELHPEVPIARRSLGLAYQHLGRTAEAVRELRVAMAGEENISVMRQVYALCRRAGDEAGCAEMLDRMFRTMADAPDRYQAPGWVNEGLHLGLLRAYDASLRFLDHAVRAFPDDVDAWHNRAVTLLFLGRPEDAVASADRALALRAGLPQVRFLLGIACLLAGDPGRAGREWARLQDDHPDHRYAAHADVLLTVARTAGLETMLRQAFAGDAASLLYYR